MSTALAIGLKNKGIKMRQLDNLMMPDFFAERCWHLIVTAVCKPSCVISSNTSLRIFAVAV
jgi:hypothetical protein